MAMASLPPESRGVKLGRFLSIGIAFSYDRHAGGQHHDLRYDWTIPAGKSG
jgi:hypothetical protein